MELILEALEISCVFYIKGAEYNQKLYISGPEQELNKIEKIVTSIDKNNKQYREMTKQIQALCEESIKNNVSYYKELNFGQPFAINRIDSIDHVDRFETDDYLNRVQNQQRKKNYEKQERDRQNDIIDGQVAKKFIEARQNFGLNYTIVDNHTKDLLRLLCIAEPAYTIMILNQD